MMNVPGGASAAVMLTGYNNGRCPRNSLYSDCVIEEKTVVLQKKDNEGFGFVLRGAKGKSRRLPAWVPSHVCVSLCVHACMKNVPQLRKKPFSWGYSVARQPCSSTSCLFKHRSFL